MAFDVKMLPDTASRSRLFSDVVMGTVAMAGE
jgi:hypothetical protein